MTAHGKIAEATIDTSSTGTLYRFSQERGCQEWPVTIAICGSNLRYVVTTKSQEARSQSAVSANGAWPAELDIHPEASILLFHGMMGRGWANNQVSAISIIMRPVRGRSCRTRPSWKRLRRCSGHLAIQLGLGCWQDSPGSEVCVTELAGLEDESSISGHGLAYPNGRRPVVWFLIPDQGPMRLYGASLACTPKGEHSHP